MRTATSNKLRPLTELQNLTDKFIIEVQDLIRIGAYDLEYIINADKTGIRIEHISSKTISEVGGKHVYAYTTGKSKENITAMVAGTSTGKKLPLMIILKGKGVKRV